MCLLENRYIDFWLHGEGKENKTQPVIGDTKTKSEVKEKGSARTSLSSALCITHRAAVGNGAAPQMLQGIERGGSLLNGGGAATYSLAGASGMGGASEW